MSDKILEQEDIDKLVSNLSQKKKANKDGKLSQKEIDQVIQEFVSLTNTNLSQDQIDKIISTFDQEFKPEL